MLQNFSKTLHWIALHCKALHRIALHCKALHSTGRSDYIASERFRAGTTFPTSRTFFNPTAIFTTIFFITIIIIIVIDITIKIIVFHLFWTSAVTITSPSTILFFTINPLKITSTCCCSDKDIWLKSCILLIMLLFQPEPTRLPLGLEGQMVKHDLRVWHFLSQLWQCAFLPPTHILLWSMTITRR